MLADLEDNYLHVGMPQSDIISLLGSPDHIYNENPTPSYNLCWEYYLPEEEFDSGDGSLFLIFDDNKLFERCEVFMEYYSEPIFRFPFL